MAIIEDPPIQAVFAEAMDYRDAAKVPNLKIGNTWMRWVFSIFEAIVASARHRGSVRLQAHAASVPTTPIVVAELSAGLWRISWYVRVRTPATVSSDITVSVFYPAGAVTQTDTGATLNGNTTLTHESKTFLVRCDAGGPISVSTTYNSVGATPMDYDLDVVVEEVRRDEQ